MLKTNNTFNYTFQKFNLFLNVSVEFKVLASRFEMIFHSIIAANNSFSFKLISHNNVLLTETLIRYMTTL